MTALIEDVLLINISDEYRNHNNDLVTETDRLVLLTTTEGKKIISYTREQLHVVTRPSGKVSTYTKQCHRVTLSRTRDGLILERNSSGGTTTSCWVWASQRGGLRPSCIGNMLTRMGVHDQRDEIASRMIEHLGPIPTWQEHLPLMDPDHRDFLRERPKASNAFVLKAWVNAPDAATVARNLFGKTRYRKPLAGLVTTIDPVVLAFYALFRGLVPIEHIIDALRRNDGYTTNRVGHIEAARIRIILRATPASVLSRLLQTSTRELVISLSDMTCVRVDPVQLARAIELRGPRNIRTPAHLEQLARALPLPELTSKQKRMQASAHAYQREVTLKNALDRINDERETPLTWEQWKDPAVRDEHEAAYQAAVMARRTRAEREAIERAEQYRQERLAREAERAQWAQDTASTLADLELPEGHRLQIATAPQQLSDWGLAMHHCLGSYTSHMGLDVFGAIVTAEGKMMANIQITHESGLVQFYGKHDTYPINVFGRNLAVDIVNVLGKHVPIQRRFAGSNGLELLSA